MLSQFEDMIIAKLVEQLNSRGVNIDAATVKRAITNSPDVIQQVQSILSAPTSQEKLDKITTLLKQAAGTGGTTTTQTTTGTTTTSKG